MDIREFLSGFREFDYNNLDFSQSGSWPAAIKTLCCLVLVALVSGAGYWFFVKDLGVDLERARGEELRLREDLKSKQFRAANLDAFRQQLEEMRATFGSLLDQLPEETEVPDLLDEISFTGLESGLEFDTIKLEADKKKEFYIETPIRMKVKGGYHEIGGFVSGVSALPRIVTLHDFQLVTGGDNQGRAEGSEAQLSLEISAKTYRYNPEGSK